MFKKLIPFAVVATMAFAGSSSALAAKQTFVTIGTGGITGVYYPTGGAIAKVINEQQKTYNIKASVESTGGSKFNINAIAVGDLDHVLAGGKVLTEGDGVRAEHACADLLAVNTDVYGVDSATG